MVGAGSGDVLTAVREMVSTRALANATAAPWPDAHGELRRCTSREFPMLRAMLPGSIPSWWPRRL